MPIYEALASWWVGAAVMASFVICMPEGVTFTLTLLYSTSLMLTAQVAHSVILWCHGLR